jgi:chromosome segregation ATPase
MLGAEPSSVPVPLLVLGGMSLALLAAGGLGYLSRRRELEKTDRDLDAAETTLRRLEAEVDVFRVRALRDLSADIQAKRQLAEELEAEIAEAQSLLALSLEQVAAVRSVVSNEVRRETRRSIVWGIVISALSVVAGFVLGNL